LPKDRAGLTSTLALITQKWLVDRVDITNRHVYQVNVYQRVRTMPLEQAITPVEQRKSRFANGKHVSLSKSGSTAGFQPYRQHYPTDPHFTLRINGTFEGGNAITRRRVGTQNAGAEPSSFP